MKNNPTLENPMTYTCLTHVCWLIILASDKGYVQTYLREYSRYYFEIGDNIPTSIADYPI